MRAWLSGGRGAGGQPASCASPFLPEHGVVLSSVKLWVLAMLAPRSGGLCGAPVQPQAANLTGLARDAGGMTRSGRRNRRFDRTKEHRQARQSRAPPLSG
jgi:hypothetical protein